MKYLISTFILIFCITIFALYALKLFSNSENSISAYYNANGAFAGFIQKKDGLIRAC